MRKTFTDEQAQALARVVWDHTGFDDPALFRRWLDRMCDALRGAQNDPADAWKET